MFEWGKNEVIVGRRRGPGIRRPGRRLARSKWAATNGRSSAFSPPDGGAAESEIWTDAKVLQDAYNRGDSFQSVYVRLNSPGAFQAFKDSLTSNPQLNVKVDPAIRLLRRAIRSASRG